MTFVSVAGLYYVSCNFIQIKIKFNQWIFFGVILSLISSIVNFYFGFEMILTIVNLFLVMAFMLYKGQTLVNTLLGTILAFGTILSINTIGNGLASLFVVFFNFNLYTILTTEITTLLTLTIAYFTSKILGKLMKNFLAFSWVNKKDNKYSLILLISLYGALLFIFFINSNSADYNFPLTNIDSIELLWMLNSFLMLIAVTFLITLLYAFSHIKSQNMVLKHNQELIDNYEISSMDIDDVLTEAQIQRHDTVNIFTSAFLYITNNDFEGWKKYFEEEIYPIYKNSITLQPEVFIELRKVSSISVRGLLQSKFLEAIRHKIKVQIEIEKNTDTIAITDIDMIRILGIILDNAIEECKKKPNMKIVFTLFQKNNTVIVKIINDIDGDPPDMSKISSKGYSTKGKDRGLGLHAVERMAGKYKGALVHTCLNKEKDNFIVKIHIPTSLKM